MHEVERRALLRGAEYWLPLILFGADAAMEREEKKPTTLSDLPGGQIVRAF